MSSRDAPTTILTPGRLTGPLIVAPSDLAPLAPPRGSAATAAAEDVGAVDEEPEHVPVAVVVGFEDLDVGSEKLDDEREG